MEGRDVEEEEVAGSKAVDLWAEFSHQVLFAKVDPPS